METLLQLNTDLYLWIFHLGSQNVWLDRLMIFGANYLIFLVPLISMILFFRSKDARNRKAVLLYFLAFIVGFILLKLLGLFIYEPRPFMTLGTKPLISFSTDDSFPSDHTLVMSIITFSYFYYRTKIRWALLIMTVWVGLSRIYVGVHYPLDILGGLLLGAIAVYLSVLIKNRVLKAS